MFWTAVYLVILGFYLLMCLATVLYWAVLSIGDGRSRKSRPQLECRVHKAPRIAPLQEQLSAESKDATER
ncbi:hypothetical protein M4951_23820 [Blastopirellula sp. J2-11]|uniref:hypothetical protein n=1 Tax=Blastopirellula sp. J2-11 TaxID=2943192 RepID=UPI0021CA0A58|nr:hypothetical protein [Blastopirellula sp. J2-11]UUO06363.1 hypothetical protein M4951_23820 [Blastopirellula sp. J2-11]